MPIFSVSSLFIKINTIRELGYLLIKNLKQEWLLALENKIQTHERFKRTFIYYDIDTNWACVFVS